MDIKLKYAAQGSKLVTSAFPAPQRFNTKKCSTCGIGSTVLISAQVDEVLPNHSRFCRGFESVSGAKVVAEFGGVPVVECRGCAKHMIARPVLGRFSARVKCDARCTNAMGHDCTCACGGKNHGAGQVAA